MTYLVAADLPTAPAGERFRALLGRPGILQLPGAHNGMAALQARAAGFDAAYLSGAAMTASMGLPDLGIFANEKVYTVFLDMRGTAADHAPSWTLQYARLRSAAEQADPISAPEGISPPFPLTKEMPGLNSELIRKYLRNVIVVYAVMDKEGKLHNLAVKQTPDGRFNPPILAALSHWTFQPAQFKGQPIALKVLIGIPLLPYR